MISLIHLSRDKLVGNVELGEVLQLPLHLLELKVSGALLLQLAQRWCDFLLQDLNVGIEQYHSEKYHDI